MDEHDAVWQDPVVPGDGGPHPAYARVEELSARAHAKTVRFSKVCCLFWPITTAVYSQALILLLKSICFFLKINNENKWSWGIYINIFIYIKIYTETINFIYIYICVCIYIYYIYVYVYKKDCFSMLTLLEVLMLLPEEVDSRHLRLGANRYLWKYQSFFFTTLFQVFTFV